MQLKDITGNMLYNWIMLDICTIVTQQNNWKKAEYRQKVKSAKWTKCLSTCIKMSNNLGKTMFKLSQSECLSYTVFLADL